MTTLCTALNTPFTPAVGNFATSVAGGHAILQRQNATGAPWVTVAAGVDIAGAKTFDNPVATCNYQFIAPPLPVAAPIVQADQ
jgi:hypothetical protein